MVAMVVVVYIYIMYMYISSIWPLHDEIFRFFHHNFDGIHYIARWLKLKATAHTRTHFEKKNTFYRHKYNKHTYKYTYTICTYVRKYSIGLTAWFSVFNNRLSLLFCHLVHATQTPSGHQMDTNQPKPCDGALKAPEIECVIQTHLVNF